MAQPVTAFDIVTQAMQEIGVLAVGETPGASEGQIGLTKLNRLADQWSARRLFIYTMVFLEQFTLTPNHQPHTIGPSLADFALAQRPLKMESAAIYLNGAGPNRVKVTLNIRDDDWWASQTLPGLTNSLPTDLYYDAAFPNGNLWFWPISNQAYPLELEVWQGMPQFPGMKTQFWMPPGYWDAVVYTLAESLVGVFEAGSGVDLAAIRDLARRSRLTIQGPNSAAPGMRTSDIGVPSGTTTGNRADFNWVSGLVTSR
jgi:hypothetical protein